jgi:hypothetical protein
MLLPMRLQSELTQRSIEGEAAELRFLRELLY